MASPTTLELHHDGDRRGLGLVRPHAQSSDRRGLQRINRRHPALDLVSTGGYSRPARSEICDLDGDGDFEAHWDVERAANFQFGFWRLDTDCDGAPEPPVELPTAGDQGRSFAETFTLLKAELALHRAVPCAKS